MKLKTLIAAPLVALLVTALAATPDPLRDEWLRINTAECTSLTEAAASAPTAQVLLLDCSGAKGGVASLERSITAQNYAGKRVRLTAQVQGDELGTGWLWLRGDTKQEGGQQEARVFDGMQQRPLMGSFGWREASVVLQIPEDVDSLNFGIGLAGAGKLRATQFRLEAVPDSVAETGGPIAALPAPTHLRFPSPQ